MVEFSAEFSEVVDNGRFGFAADLAPLPASVVAVAERALAAPRSGAVAVAFGVAAGFSVLEGDAVFAASAPGGRSGKGSP